MKTPAQYLSSQIPARARERRVFAAKAAAVLVVMLAVFFLFSLCVRDFAYYDMPGMPGASSTDAFWTELWISLAVPTLAFVACVIRGNVLDSYYRSRLEGVGKTLLITPVGVIGGVIVWALGTWLTPASEALLAYALGLILAVASAATLRHLWGLSAAARAAVRADLAARINPGRGQVWFAQVPFEDQADSKDRPVLILDLNDAFVWGLYFTSTDHTGDGNFMRAPASMWEDGKSSYLRLDRPLQINRNSLRRRACWAPEGFLRQVDEWGDQNLKAPRRPRVLPSAARG